MHAHKLPTIEGCPFTHLFAASRFAKPSRYLAGRMGVEFSAPSYLTMENSKSHIFEIKPVFDLSQTPWLETKTSRIGDALWLIHPENNLAGIGLFNSETTANESANQMKIRGYRMRVAELGESFRTFLDPLWESVSHMADSFWDNATLDHSQYQESFDDGLRVLRSIQKARTLIGICRMRENHPYW